MSVSQNFSSVFYCQKANWWVDFVPPTPVISNPHPNQCVDSGTTTLTAGFSGRNGCTVSWFDSQGAKIGSGSTIDVGPFLT